MKPFLVTLGDFVACNKTINSPLPRLPDCSLQDLSVKYGFIGLVFEYTSWCNMLTTFTLDSNSIFIRGPSDPDKLRPLMDEGTH